MEQITIKITPLLADVMKRMIINEIQFQQELIEDEEENDEYQYVKVRLQIIDELQKLQSDLPK